MEYLDPEEITTQQFEGWGDRFLWVTVMESLWRDGAETGA